MATIDEMLVPVVVFCTLVMIIGAAFEGGEIIENSFDIDKPDDWVDYVTFLPEVIIGVLSFLWNVLTFNFFGFPVIVRVILAATCNMTIILFVLTKVL